MPSMLSAHSQSLATCPFSLTLAYTRLRNCVHCPTILLHAGNAAGVCVLELPARQLLDGELG